MIDFTEQLRRRIETPDQREHQILYKELSYAIVGAAIEVHKHVGPGKLESCYQAAMEAELALRKIQFRRQVPIPMLYKGTPIGGFFADLIVDEKVIVELKAAADTRRSHRAQLLSYLHYTKLRLGILINFDVPVLIHGVRRVVY